MLRVPIQFDMRVGSLIGLPMALKHRMRVLVLASSILVVLAFGGCFARQKILSRSGRIGQWGHWKGNIVSQVKTKAARRGIAPKTKGKVASRIIPEFVTVLKHSQHKGSNSLSRQFGKVLLRDCAEGGYKHGITCYYGALSLFSYRAIFFVLSSAKSSIKWMSVSNSSRFLFAPNRQKRSQSPPCELGRQVSAILKINDDFCILCGVFGNYEITDDSIFSTYSDIGPLANLQSVFAGPKLLLNGFQLTYSSSRSNNYCQQSDGLNSKPYLVTYDLLAFAGALGIYFSLWLLQFRIDGYCDWGSWAGLMMSIFVFAHFSSRLGGWPGLFAFSP